MKGFRRFLCIVFLAGSLFNISCASKPSVQEKLTVAVWDLDDLSLSSTPQLYSGEVLSGQIIQVLMKKGNIEVVERERLVLALGELQLGSTSLVDETTRLKLGRLVGARLMVFGGYQIIEGRTRLDLRLVHVETGKIRKAVKKTGLQSNLIETVTQAAEELL